MAVFRRVRDEIRDRLVAEVATAGLIRRTGAPHAGPGDLLQFPNIMDRLSRILAARLREERRRRRLSLRKLAETSGLSPTTVHQIEAGRGSPSLATLQALASTLGVPLAALFESGPPPPEPAVLLPAGKRPRTRTRGGSLERLATACRASGSAASSSRLRRAGIPARRR